MYIRRPLMEVSDVVFPKTGVCVKLVVGNGESRELRRALGKQ